MIHSRRRSREGEDAPRRASRLAVVRRRCYTFVASGERSFARSRSTLVILFRMRRIFSFDHPHERRNARALESALESALLRSHSHGRSIERVRPHVRYRLLPYMTPLSHHVGECIALDRESPRKSPTSYVHTLSYGTITRTLSPFPPIKYTHPAGRSPSRRVGCLRIQNYSLSLGRRSVDADARRPTIDRARA